MNVFINETIHATHKHLYVCISVYINLYLYMNSLFKIWMVHILMFLAKKFVAFRVALIQRDCIGDPQVCIFHYLVIYVNFSDAHTGFFG